MSERTRARSGPGREMCGQVAAESLGSTGCAQSLTGLACTVARVLILRLIARAPNGSVLRAGRGVASSQLVGGVVDVVGERATTQRGHAHSRRAPRAGRSVDEGPSTSVRFGASVAPGRRLLNWASVPTSHGRAPSAVLPHPSPRRPSSSSRTPPPPSSTVCRTRAASVARTDAYSPSLNTPKRGKASPRRPPPGPSLPARPWPTRQRRATAGPCTPRNSRKRAITPSISTTSPSIPSRRPTRRISPTPRQM